MTYLLMSDSDKHIDLVEDYNFLHQILIGVLLTCADVLWKYVLFSSILNNQMACSYLWKFIQNFYKETSVATGVCIQTTKQYCIKKIILTSIEMTASHSSVHARDKTCPVTCKDHIWETSGESNQWHMNGLP